MSTSRKLVYERLEKAIKLYVDNQNLSVIACAEAAYVSESLLKKELKKRGLTRDLSEIQSQKLENAIAFYQDGLSVYAASRKACIGNSTLQQALEQRGLIRQQRQTKSLNIQAAIEFYQQGMTVNAAAVKAKVGHSTLVEALRKQQLLRKQDEALGSHDDIYMHENKEAHGYSKALQLLHRSARNNHAA